MAKPNRTAGEDALRSRLVGAFGADVLDASDLELLEDEDGLVCAQVGGVRVSLVGGFLVCTAVYWNFEHLGVVEVDGRIEWLARVEISPSGMN